MWTSADVANIPISPDRGVEQKGSKRTQAQSVERDEDALSAHSADSQANIDMLSARAKLKRLELAKADASHHISS